MSRWAEDVAVDEHTSLSGELVGEVADCCRIGRSGELVRTDDDKASCVHFRESQTEVE